MVNYIIEKDKVDLALLSEFVKFVDKDFVPPLVGRVDIDLWIEKVYDKGSIVLAEYGDVYVGCLLFYANDVESRTGYIAYLAVESQYRRLGIAKKMLECCFNISRASSMSSISAYTNNPHALSLYKRMGFVEKSSKVIEEYSVTRTFLIKQL